MRFWLDPPSERWAALLLRDGFSVGDWAAGDEPFEGCVVDGRGLSPRDMSALRKCAGKIAAFDDHDVPTDGCDIVISPWGRTPAQRSAKPVLSGLGYALVDHRFSSLPLPDFAVLPARVLVACGYRDSPNATGRLLGSLSRLSAGGWCPTVIVALGAEAPNRDAVSASLVSFGKAAHLVEGADDMLRLVQECDLAIGAGGTSALERAAAGRPSVSVALNDGQVGLIAALADAGATVDAGHISSVKDADLDRTMWRLASDVRYRRALAQRARIAVDGQGAIRLAEALLSSVGMTPFRTSP